METSKDGKRQVLLKLGPHYTLLVPFSPPLNRPNILFNKLKSAGNKAEKELYAKYSKKEAAFLIKELRKKLKEVKYIPYGKTLAIFVSRFSSKIHYFTSTRTLPLPPVRIHGENRKRHSIQINDHSVH